MPMSFCMMMLTKAMLVQQQKPSNIGFSPVLISLTKFVFNPIADMAMTIKNLLIFLIGAVTLIGRLKIVVTNDASRK